MPTMTNQWKCDTCGGWAKAESLYLEWIYNDPPAPGAPDAIVGLRLTHSAKKCLYDDAKIHRETGRITAGSNLSSFLGADGLMQLAKLVAEGANRDDIAAIIQRLHVPGYEQAREHFETAIEAEVIEPNLPPKFHWQRDLDAIRDWALGNL